MPARKPSLTERLKAEQYAIMRTEQLDLGHCWIERVSGIVNRAEIVVKWTNGMQYRVTSFAEWQRIRKVLEHG